MLHKGSKITSSASFIHYRPEKKNTSLFPSLSFFGDKRKTSTMANITGKRVTTLLLFLLFIQYIHTSPTTLRGGLLYTEATSNQAIFINQNMLPITRQIDSTALASGIEIQKDLVKLYANHCDRVALSLEGKAHPLALSGNSDQPFISPQMTVTMKATKNPYMIRPRWLSGIMSVLIQVACS